MVVLFEVTIVITDIITSMIIIITIIEVFSWSIIIIESIVRIIIKSSTMVKARKYY